MEKVYLQTYSLGSAMRDDFMGSLEKVSQIGYTGVEFAGGYGDMEAGKLKTYLNQLDLDPISTHVGLEMIEGQLPYLAELGVQYVICPGTSFPSYERTLEVAAELNRLGKLAAEYGLKVGYHNHTHEFAKFNDKYILDIIMENTDPEYVLIQLDVGWATCAGIDVPAYLVEHSGRIQAIHVKETNQVFGVQKERDYSKFAKDENGQPIIPQEVLDERLAIKKSDCPTGEGIIDWQNICDVAKENGAKVFIIEREYDYKGDDIFGCVAEDLTYVRTIRE